MNNNKKYIIAGFLSVIPIWLTYIIANFLFETVLIGRNHNMNLQPLGDRVVVRPLDEEDMKTPSGIYIPDTAKEKPQEGEVVAVGPGELNEKGERIEIDVNKGDKVIYSKYGGTEIKVEGTEYLILSSRDILAKVEK